MVCFLNCVKILLYKFIVKIKVLVFDVFWLIWFGMWRQVLVKLVVRMEAENNVVGRVEARLFLLQLFLFPVETELEGIVLVFCRTKLVLQRAHLLIIWVKGRSATVTVSFLHHKLVKSSHQFISRIAKLLAKCLHLFSLLVDISPRPQHSTPQYLHSLPCANIPCLYIRVNLFMFSSDRLVSRVLSAHIFRQKSWGRGKAGYV